MKTIQYNGVVSPWYDTLGGSGLTWTTGMQAELENDVADELLGYVTLFSFISESGSSVTLPTMQAAFDAGTATEKAAFQSSVSGDGIVFSNPLTKDPAGPTLTFTGATGPAGVTSYPNTTTIYDYVVNGPTSALAASAAFIRGALMDRHMEVTFGTNSADFYVTLIRIATNANLWWREFGSRKWIFAGNISLDASGAFEYLRVQFSAAGPREFKVVGINLPWANIKTQTTDVVFRCTDYGEPFAHMTCDSYGVGVGGIAGSSAAAPCQLVQYLGYRPVIDAISGSGWLTASPNTPTQRVTKSIAATVRKNGGGAETPVVFAKSFYFIGYNDASGDQGLIAASIDAMYAAHPAPKPDFFGPWEPLGPQTNITTTAATISARAAVLAAKFVPMSLICNTGNSAGVTSSDNVHPRQEGHNYWAINGAKRAAALGLKAA